MGSDHLMRQFSKHCALSVHEIKGAMHPEHKPGEVMQAGWAGNCPHNRYGYIDFIDILFK
jgi:hypothetical protein